MKFPDRLLGLTSWKRVGILVGKKRASTTKRSRSSDSPPSASRYENYVIKNEVSGQNLRHNVAEACKHTDRVIETSLG